MGISGYRFADTSTHARKSMSWYAAMFERGPVADLGAGRGYFVEALRSRGVECVGVDISEEAVAEARRIGVDVVLGDALEFLAERSDLGGAFVSHLIEHLAPPGVDELFRAASRAIRADGTIVIVTPNPRDWLVLSEVFWLDPTHVRPYPTRLVTAMLETAGFRVDGVGLRRLSMGRRTIPGHIVDRIRFGSEFGLGEAWVRARRAGGT